MESVLNWHKVKIYPVKKKSIQMVPGFHTTTVSVWSKQRCRDASVARSCYSKNCLAPRGDYYGNHHKSYARVCMSLSTRWSSPKDESVSSYPPRSNLSVAPAADDESLSFTESGISGLSLIITRRKTITCFKKTGWWPLAVGFTNCVIKRRERMESYEQPRVSVVA